MFGHAEHGRHKANDPPGESREGPAPDKLSGSKLADGLYPANFHPRQSRSGRLPRLCKRGGGP